MPIQIPNPKQVLRRQVQTRLNQMSPAERAAASAQVCLRLKQQSAWDRARLVVLFAPLGQEIDVWPLLAEALASGKTVALPRFEPAIMAYVACRIESPGRDLVIGKFGIREPGAHCPPVPAPAVDLILAPGVAFDLNGHRLGRGKGFYDRMLGPHRGMKCGTAFDQQVVGDLPAEQHDVRMDCLLTPTQWIEFGAAPVPADPSAAGEAAGG